MHVFYSKFRMIVFHNHRTLSLNFKSSRLQMFFKIGVLTEKIYWKENSPQVFSCKYCKIFKNTYFEEHLRTAAFIMTYYNHKVSNKHWAPAGKIIMWVEWFLPRFLDLVRDNRILTGLVDRFCFCPLLNVYFSDMSINKWRIF